MGGVPGRSGSGAGRPASGRGRPDAPGAGRRPLTAEQAAKRQELEQRTYDPRREERRKLTRVHVPDDVDPRMLDQEARRELRSLSKETADLVARHLVMTGRLLDEDPEGALRHARAAGAMAGRVAVVREAVGLAAYANGEWADALSELRAARRISGSPEHLAVMADCERALGRPERALRYLEDRSVPQLDNAQRVELVIVVSGARRDLDQADAAVVLLQDPARRTTGQRPWAARLWYALADALLDAGREDEAREWFGRSAEVDEAGETDADERLMALDGVVFEDAWDDTEGEVLDGSDGHPAPDSDTPAGVDAGQVMADFAAAFEQGVPPVRPAPAGAAASEAAGALAPEAGPEAGREVALDGAPEVEDEGGPEVEDDGPAAAQPDDRIGRGAVPAPFSDS